MPEYLSPGVYIEELNTGPRPIEGVSTSTAGFVGQTERGPEMPKLVTSWLDYQRWFGGYLPVEKSYLPYTVQGFFDNGGQRLYVARVVAKTRDDPAAPKDPARASNNFGDLTISAIGRGEWGNRIFVSLERATQAKPGRSNANWVKLSVVYYASRAPTKEDILAATTQAASAAAQSAGISANATKDLANNIDALTTPAGGDPTNAGQAKAAKDATEKVNAAAKAASAAARVAKTAAGEAKSRATAAVAADPSNPAVQAALLAATAADKAADQADKDASTAATDADKAAQAASANVNIPSAANATAAQNLAAAAKATIGTAQGSASAAQISAAAAAAGPVAVVDAALTAQKAAQQVAVTVGYAKADPTDATKAVIAQKAAVTADESAKSLQAAAMAAEQKAAADAQADPTNKSKSDAKKAATDARTAADNLVTATSATVVVANANAAAPSPANILAVAQASDTGVNKAELAVQTAKSAADQAALAAGPQVLAVSPLRPANRKDPSFASPDYIEIFDNLQLARGTSNSLDTTVNGASRLIHITLDGMNVPLSPQGEGADKKAESLFTALSGGSEGTKAELEDYKGSPAPIDESDLSYGVGYGLQGLGAIEGISLIAAPDEVSIGTLTNEVVNQCESLRDRFGIVSVDGNTRMGDSSPSLPADTTYAAFYYPWIEVFDQANNQYIDIPATGHITGLIARVDIDRGVHKAPANEVVRDATDLQYPVAKGNQDILNPVGVNCIRDFRDSQRGIRLYGARTMSSDPAWKYINIRRLFIFIEQSIYRGTQWVVFEPNDEPLWAAVRRSIRNFLVSVWKTGALMGQTEQEAFFVKCDRTTMTQNDIENGHLVCYIGVAPTRPAEFVIFRISQKTADAPA